MSKEELFEIIRRYIDFKYNNRIIILALLVLDKELLRLLFQKYIDVQDKDEIIDEFLTYCENNLSFSKKEVEEFRDKLMTDMIYTLSENDNLEDA